MSLQLGKRLLGFTTLGAGILIGTFWWQSSHQAYEPIHISLKQLKQAEGNWQARWGREPNERDREIILRNESNEEVLFREALKAGLHRSDPIVKRRLWQNMQFLELEEQDLSGMELLERAYELGMHESDVVVRRRMVQRFHRTLMDAATPAEPSREEVEAFIAQDPEPFETIPRFSFVQIFVDGEREDGPPERAQVVLEQLQRAGDDVASSAPLGDPLPLQREFQGVTPVDLAKRFGHRFTEEIALAPAGQWSGPYASTLGWHVVWLEEYRPAQVVLDDATLDKARGLLVQRRKEAMVRNALAELRQRYEIVVGIPGDTGTQREG